MTAPSKETDQSRSDESELPLERLHQERQEIVATLSEENARLLVARQRASGVEIEVLAAQHNGDTVAIAELRKREAAARRELSDAEQRIEDLEDRMAAVISALVTQNK